METITVQGTGTVWVLPDGRILWELQGGSGNMPLPGMWPRGALRSSAVIEVQLPVPAEPETVQAKVVRTLEAKRD